MRQCTNVNMGNSKVHVYCCMLNLSSGVYYIYSSGIFILYWMSDNWLYMYIYICGTSSIFLGISGWMTDQLPATEATSNPKGPDVNGS